MRKLKPTQILQRLADLFEEMKGHEIWTPKLLVSSLGSTNGYVLPNQKLKLDSSAQEQIRNLGFEVRLVSKG